MSDIIKFNTESALKEEPVSQNIVTYNLISENHPLLKEPLLEFDFNNPPVNPNLFASGLVETCKKYKGYGLSANQCGFKYRVFVAGANEQYVAFFNPKIISSSKEEVMMTEGCLSFPMLALNISRPAEIMVEYQDFNAQVHNTKLVGLSARIFQHELDHMNGIVYTDKVKPLALQMGMKKRGKIKTLINKMEKNLKKIDNGNTNRVR